MGWYENWQEREKARTAAEISSLARATRAAGLKNMYGQPITEEGDPHRPPKTKLTTHRHKDNPRIQQRWRAPGWGKKEPRGRWPGYGKRYSR